MPALTELAKTGSSLVGRFHALWTLEGLGKLDAALVRELLKDVSPQMRVQAIRASESLTKAGDKTFEADVRARLKDGDANVIIQALLTLNLQKAPRHRQAGRGRAGGDQGARRQGARRPDAAPAAVHRRRRRRLPPDGAGAAGRR